MSNKEIYKNTVKKILSKKKEAEENIKQIEGNNFFLPTEKEGPIKRIKEALYEEISDIRSSEEYKKSKEDILTVDRKKRTIQKLKNDVKKIEQEIAQKEKELFIMRQEIGDFEPLWFEYAPDIVKNVRKEFKGKKEKIGLMEHVAKTISYNKDGSVNILPLNITFYKDKDPFWDRIFTYEEGDEKLKEKWYGFFLPHSDDILRDKWDFAFDDVIKALIPEKKEDQYHNSHVFAAFMLWFNTIIKSKDSSSDYGKKFRVIPKDFAKKNYIEFEDGETPKFITKEKKSNSTMKCGLFGYKLMA